MESARYKPVLLPTGRHYNGIALEVFSNAETIFYFILFYFKKKKKKEKKKRKKNKLLMLVVLYYLPISKLPWNNQLEQECNKS